MVTSDLHQLVTGLTMTASAHLPTGPTMGSVVQVVALAVLVVAVATAVKKGKQYI